MCGASIAFARACVARHVAPRVASRVEPRRVATMSAPRVYVGKIPRALADDAIVERALEICGALKTWKRVRDPATRAPKRFGFATFETIEGAVRCARALVLPRRALGCSGSSAAGWLRWSGRGPSRAMNATAIHNLQRWLAASRAYTWACRSAGQVC